MAIVSAADNSSVAMAVSMSLHVLAVDLVRLTVLEFVRPRFTDHLDQQVNRHESAPQAGADLDPDKGLQLVDPRRQNRKVGDLHPLEELAMALAVLVEEAGDRCAEEEEHLVALARRAGEVYEVAGEQAIRVALLPGRARLAEQPNLLRGKREHAGRMARGPQCARVGVGMVGEVRDDERLRGQAAVTIGCGVPRPAEHPCPLPPECRRAGPAGCGAPRSHRETPPGA